MYSTCDLHDVKRVLTRLEKYFSVLASHPTARITFTWLQVRARVLIGIAILIHLLLAQMEYYINKDANVARKIYEMGFKKFSQETAFVFQYIDFLFHRSDENST